MKAIECMIAWNPKTDAVMVGPWPDVTDWSRDYMYTDGACFAHLHDKHKKSRDLVIGHLFITAIHMIVRDKVDPSAVHNELCKIEEYRAGLAYDVPRPEGCPPPENDGSF